MSIFPETMFEPLREAQDQLNVRLDAILVELRAIHMLMQGTGHMVPASPPGSTVRVLPVSSQGGENGKRSLHESDGERT